jgi:aspartyl protease family protein
MRVSDSTLNLFSSLVFVMACAGITAVAMMHPEAFRSFVSKSAATLGVEIDLSTFAAKKPRVKETEVAEESSTGDVLIRAGDNGHFETPAQVNGRTIEVMVDTGATTVALTYEDARRVGINVGAADFTHESSTANGVTKIAPVVINKISIGQVTVRNVRGAVMERGKLDQTLLGMSFLSKLSKVEMSNGALVLHD